MAKQQRKEEEKKWEEVMNCDLINIYRLKKIIYKYGMPNDDKDRGIVWKLLLGYYTERKREWKQIDQKCLSEYEKYVATIYPHQESETLNKNWKKVYGDLDRSIDSFGDYVSTFDMDETETKRIQLIDNDIVRTGIGAATDRDRPVRHDLAMRRILFILSLVNGGVSYVQGMNNICNIFYTLFATLHDNNDYKMVEAETFGCMFLLIENMREWFLPESDNLPGGINDAIKEVNYYIKKRNKQLVRYMDSIGIKGELYLFRWLTLLVCMEFGVRETLKYWDFIFLDMNNMVLLKVLCSGIVLSVRRELLTKNFTQSLEFLQNLPSIPFERVMRKTKIVLKKVNYKLPLVDKKSTCMFMHIKSEQQDETTESSALKKKRALSETHGAVKEKKEEEDSEDTEDKETDSEKEEKEGESEGNEDKKEGDKEENEEEKDKKVVRKRMDSTKRYIVYKEGKE